MAIKGKTKSRSRAGRPPARAPRREPVVVRPPFAQRRWVQLVAALVAGAFAVVTAVWVTNGLRQQRSDDAEAGAAATRRAAALEWQSVFEGELGKIGTVSPTTQPAVFPELSSVIDGLAKDEEPAGAQRTIDDAITQAKAGAKALEGFDLTGTIADQGFDVAQTNYLLSSQGRVARALRLYREAGLVARLAVATVGAQRVALAERAAAIEAEAQALLNEGWTDYQQVIFAVGLGQAPAPTGIIPGLGLTGPTGGAGFTGPTGTTGTTGATGATGTP